MYTPNGADPEDPSLLAADQARRVGYPCENYVFRKQIFVFSFLMVITFVRKLVVMRGKMRSKALIETKNRRLLKTFF